MGSEKLGIRHATYDRLTAHRDQFRQREKRKESGRIERSAASVASCKKEVKKKLLEAGRLVVDPGLHEDDVNFMMCCTFAEQSRYRRIQGCMRFSSDCTFSPRP